MMAHALNSATQAASHPRLAACAFLLALLIADPHALASDDPIHFEDERTAALAIVMHEDAARAALIERIAPSVVCIFADPTLPGGGSGVLIDPRGYALTNFHVVMEFLESRVGYGGLSDGKLYPLRLVGIDPGGDIALVQLSGRDAFPFSPLGDSDALHVGQAVAALGNPFTLADDFRPSVSVGVVSGLHRYQEGSGESGSLLEYADCIQVSSSINPGNSGGPLFDMNGRVVGINGRASFEQRGRVNVGLGYAVSVNQIKRFLPTLAAGRAARHGTLGLTTRAVGGELLVSRVQEFSGVAVAGVRPGDTLLRVDGRIVRSPNDVLNVIATRPAAWTVDLEIRRDSATRHARVKLEPITIRKAPIWIVESDQNLAFARELFKAARFGEALGLEPGGRIVPNAIEPPADKPQIIAELETWTAPLLADALVLDSRWEAVDACRCDAPDGEVRTCAVVRRTLDNDDEVRWQFDAERSTLARVEFIGADASVISSWVPGEDAHVWIRIAPDGTAVSVELTAKAVAS